MVGEPEAPVPSVPDLTRRLRARLQTRQSELLINYRGFMQLSADLLIRQSELLNEQQEVLRKQQNFIEMFLSTLMDNDHE